jgi:hypothetical protein
LFEQPVLIQVLNNDTDSDGLLVPGSVAIIDQPTSGAVVRNPDTGAITYTPASGFSGSDSFTYTVTDDAGATSAKATVRIQVTPKPNLLPHAVDDGATTPFEQPVIISVLSNDLDADGTLAPASVAIVNQAANGTVVVNTETGAIAYTPASGFFGLDHFTYTVRDDRGGTSAQATVTVQVDAPPPITATKTAEVPEAPPIETLGDVSTPPLSSSPPSLLFTLPEVPQAPLAVLRMSYGSNGYLAPLPQQQWSYGSAQRSVNPTNFMRHEKVEEAILLTEFLDFVDPEMLVVDLGDEPPAQVSNSPVVTASHEQESTTEETAAANKADESNGDGPNDKSGQQVTVLKPTASDATGGAILAATTPDLSAPAGYNWKWFASAAGVLLVGAAGWMGRSNWLNAARKLRLR